MILECSAEKCAYVNIEGGKKKSLGVKFEMNGLELNKMKNAINIWAKMKT